MPRLAWRAQPTHRMGAVDDAELFGPEPVFRHISKAAKGAQSLGSGNKPAGFLENFAVQRLKRRFSGINATAGQLEFRNRLCLMGHEQTTAMRQDRIGPRPQAVRHAGLWALSESSDHFVSPGVGLS